MEVLIVTTSWDSWKAYIKSTNHSMMIAIHILQMQLINLPEVIELVGHSIELQIQVWLNLEHMLLTTRSTAPKREVLWTSTG